jgi:HSP20 family molecular chaperone IbpA
MSDWFDMDMPFRPGHPMRIEDSLTDTEYVLRVELPGLQPDKDIQVGVHDGLLSVRAERHEQERGANQRSEFRYGMMQRAVRLPASADIEHAKAAYRDGILEVSMPLHAPTDTRAIPVTTS